MDEQTDKGQDPNPPDQPTQTDPVPSVEQPDVTPSPSPTTSLPDLTKVEPQAPKTSKKKKSKSPIILGIIIIAGLIFGLIVFGVWKTVQTRRASNIIDYESCSVTKGSIIQESYPETCVTSDGRSFTRILTTDEQSQLDEPSSGYLDTVVGSLALARDTQRKSDLFSLSNGIEQYRAEYGYAPSDIPTIKTCVGTNPECYDLSQHLVPVFFVSIPQDPSTGSAGNTGYTIIQTNSSMITFETEGEQEDIIEVTR